MRRLRALGRVIADWRTGATVLGTILVILLAITVTDSIITRDDALGALRAQAAQAKSAQQAATARITELRGDIADLESDAQSNGKRIGELVAQVEALQEQVRLMCQGRTGCAPVVAVTTTTAPPSRAGPPASTTTTTAPPSGVLPPSAPSTTTTTSPPPTTTTTTPRRCVTVPLVGCVG